MSCCQASGGVWICRASYTKTEVATQRCPTCGCWRTMLCRFAEWYGWYVTCLWCGERWQDGERAPRPFAPGWRKKSSGNARKIAEAL